MTVNGTKGKYFTIFFEVSSVIDISAFSKRIHTYNVHFWETFGDKDIFI